MRRRGPQVLEINPLQTAKEARRTGNIQHIEEVIPLFDREEYEQVVKHHNQHDAVVQTQPQDLILIVYEEVALIPQSHWELHGAGSFYPKNPLLNLIRINLERNKKMAVRQKPVVKLELVPQTCQLPVPLISTTIKVNIIDNGVRNTEQTAKVALTAIGDFEPKPIYGVGVTK